MARAIDIADYIIEYASDLDRPVSNLKLQKIMYFLNAKYMADYPGKKPMITKAKFKRWAYGPTQASVYYEYRQNKDKKLTRPKSHIYIYLDDNKHTIEEFNMDCFEKNNSAQADYIKKNILTFLNMSTSYLVNESHNEPQWKELAYNEEYDNTVTYEYYHKPKNQFWRS